jgi:hypothetical protein
MSKQIRMISLEQNINERLGQTGNASALIERLLNEHFAYLTLEDAKPKDLSEEKAKLQEQIVGIEQREVIEAEKGSILKRLTDIGMYDENVINYLKNRQLIPSYLEVKEIKLMYPKVKLDSVQIFDAWRILHEDSQGTAEGYP